MSPTRVLVANQPRLMRDLVVETISGQPDIEIVGEVHDDSMILALVEQTRPDCLIIELRGSDDRPGICDVLLERYPQMRILALAPDRNSSIYFWASLDIHANRVEASEEGVLQAVRSCVALAGRVQ